MDHVDWTKEMEAKWKRVLCEDEQKREKKLLCSVGEEDKSTDQEEKLNKKKQKKKITKMGVFMHIGYVPSAVKGLLTDVDEKGNSPRLWQLSQRTGK